MMPALTSVDFDIGNQLAAFLADRREMIVTQWTDSVRHDEELKTVKGLNPEQLVDNLPKILDSLSQTLTEAFRRDVKDQAVWRAARHGQIRWKQDYDISEVIREFAHLRTTLMEHLAQFHELHTEFNGAACFYGMIVLHRFLDDAIRASAEEYVTFSETL
jgi:hypothetical protein